MPKVDDMYDHQEVKPKARGSIHKTIIDWFAGQERGTVLDAPAGFGHLSMQLRELGYEVTSGEAEPEIYRVKDMACIKIDLNNFIDAPDNSFDYVCCVDGLEHMLNPYKAVEEFARVLKPGGIGVFSLPNYTNIEKRIRFLLKGYLIKPTKGVKEFEAAGGNLFNFHNSALTITLLDLMFGINHLEVMDVLKDKVKKKQYFYWPLVAVIKFLALCSGEGGRKKHRYELTTRNDIIFGGNTVIFIVRKAGTASKS